MYAILWKDSSGEAGVLDNKTFRTRAAALAIAKASAEFLMHQHGGKVVKEDNLNRVGFDYNDADGDTACTFDLVELNK